MTKAGGGGTNPWLIAPIVALAAFMEILDISVANVALPHTAGDLSSSQDESTWVLTSYLVTNAIVMPISGWRASRFGRKRVFLTCIGVFSVVSLLCGLAPSLPVLVLLRAVQGAAGGGVQPTGQAILNDAFPPEQRGVATSVYALATVVAPAVGPALGGWSTDNYEWRWVFLINVPIGAALLLLINSLVRSGEADKAHTGGPVDWQGFTLIALTLGCLQVVLDRGQEYDWFAEFLQQLQQLNHAAAAGLRPPATVARLAMQQVVLLSYLHAFKALGITFLLLLPLVFFMKGGTASAGAKEAA